MNMENRKDSAIFYLNNGDTFRGALEDFQRQIRPAFGSQIVGVEIEEGCTVLPSYMFSRLNSLQFVKLPDSITKIGRGAFRQCKNLESVTLPPNVTELEKCAFDSCENLRTVSWPDELHVIGESAFRNCGKLEVPLLPKQLEVIGAAAFSGCVLMTAVTIPKSVIWVGTHAFRNCPNLETLEMTRLWRDYHPAALLDNGLRTLIMNGALNRFSRMPGVETLVVKGRTHFNVSNILCISSHRRYWDQSSAYDPFPDLRHISIEGECDYFKVVNGVVFSKDMRKLLLYPRKKDGNYIIPDTVKEIEVDAFYCAELDSVTIPDSVEIIRPYAFCGAKLQSVSIPDSVHMIGEGAFSECRSLTSVRIPDSVRMIGEGAFERCYRLTSVRMPEGITEIRDKMFYFCYHLQSVILPESVEVIGRGTFEYCENLTKIEIPDSIREIRSKAFCDCKTLKPVLLPEYVKLAEDAFVSSWSYRKNKETAKIFEWGRMFEEGREVQQNHRMAVFWYRHAAALGHEEASHKLASLPQTTAGEADNI